jgi:prevent-host-death family protein
MQLNMFEAKSQLSRLVQAALRGEEVLIANKGKPLVKLVKIASESAPRKPGAWSDLPAPAADWDGAATNRKLAAELVGKP